MKATHMIKRVGEGDRFHCFNSILEGKKCFVKNPKTWKNDEAYYGDIWLYRKPITKKPGYIIFYKIYLEPIK